MFERFTDRARRVVVLAQEEARILSHNYIGTEHILLGLIREDEGIAAKALAALDISLDDVRAAVQEIVGTGDRVVSGHIPFTPRAKKVLELSLREALQLGHNYIGTEHILLGLIREGEGVAANVLIDLGADMLGVREQVTQLLGTGGAPESGTLRATVARMIGGRAGPGPRPVLARLDAMDSRMRAVELRVGTGPEHGDLDQRIEALQAEKRAAAAAEDYERAAALRDEEKLLLADRASRRAEWTAGHPDLPSLADTIRKLSDEVKRLGDLLRQHGIDSEGEAFAGGGEGAAGADGGEGASGADGGGRANGAGSGEHTDGAA